MYYIIMHLDCLSAKYLSRALGYKPARYIEFYIMNEINTPEYRLQLKVESLQQNINANPALFNLDQVQISNDGEKIKNKDEIIYEVRSAFKRLVNLPLNDFDNILEVCLDILKYKAKLHIMLKGQGINIGVILLRMNELVKGLKRQLNI